MGRDGACLAVGKIPGAGGGRGLWRMDLGGRMGRRMPARRVVALVLRELGTPQSLTSEPFREARGPAPGKL